MTRAATTAPHSDVAPRRRYHSHAPGLLYIGFTLLLAVGAINSQNNLLFLALGLAIGGLLISGIISGPSLMGVRIERRAPGRATVGRPLRIHYRVSNANRLVPAFGLHVVELPSDSESSERLATPPRTFILHVPPAGASDAEVLIVPRTRGRIALSELRIWSTFPFGLTRKSVTFSLPRTILVFPPELPPRPGLIARFTSRSHAGAGAENTAGHGEEFFGLREYIAGDNPRRIAWKRSARLGEVVVRQNAMPSPPRLWVMLHLAAGPSQRAAPALSANGHPLSQAALDERAIALTAMLLRTASESEMAVGLAIPAARILHPPREGRAHLHRLLTDLALLEPAAARAGHTSKTIPAVIARGGACVIVHAAASDPSVGPPSAHHLAAASADQYLAMEHNGAAAILAILDSAGQPQISRAQRRRAAPDRPVGGAA
jgi:uncharacterized protein (DUF58 family)